ncbi:MAG: phosphodiester glycosidase family protein [Brevundimonas sp.]
MNRRAGLMLIGAVLIFGVGVVLWNARTAPPLPRMTPTLPAPCREQAFEGDAYVVCVLPPDRYAISLAHNDGEVDAAAKVTDFVRARSAAGRSPVLVMNAGMYDAELDAIGLLIEDGRELKPLNLRDGPGNFHLKPNGVFAIDRSGRARVVESTAWTRGEATAFATQSGPMLVLGGALHPAFDLNGVSRYRRNGVGVRKDGAVVLAISRRRVSFGAFARLFRDALACPDALFLDGAVSALAGPQGSIVGGPFAAGPVIVVDQTGE